MPNRIEKVASEAMGTVKTVKAKVENFSGIFKQLTREHGEVMALLLRVKVTSDPAVRRELFPQIRQELISHEVGELTVVYPVFREDERLAGYAEAHETEAGMLERMLERLSNMVYGDPQWAPAFAELAGTVERHAKEEENEYFPVAMRILGKDVAEQMRLLDLAKRPVTNGHG